MTCNVHACRMREVYDLMIKTLRLQTDDTIHVPKAVARAVYKPLDTLRNMLPNLPMDNYFSSSDYVEESTYDSVAPAGALGYEALGIKPSKVSRGCLMYCVLV